MRVSSIQDKNRPDMSLDLTVMDDKFAFSTSIVDAIAQAEIDIVQLNETVDSIKNLTPNCDKLDYILAASSGALCGIIDVFLVEVPGSSALGDVTVNWFENRVKAFARLCDKKGRKFETLESALRFLEKKFKIPYDQTGLGDAGRTIYNLTAKNHHFKSLAHNPSILGLFFSILDQFNNTSHFVSNGQLIMLVQADEQWKLQGNNVPSKLFCGFANWLGHLMSDISGSQSSARKNSRGMGIPSPLWTWTNDIIAIKATLNIPVSEIDKSMNQLAIDIFEKGYDTRFQGVQAIPVFINELFVRLIYSVRRLYTYFIETEKDNRSFLIMWEKCEPFSNLTVKRMLTVAHGTFCLIDAGDATARAFIAGGGNFNPVEFFLRLNIIGVGRFSISLFGETKRAIIYYEATQETKFIEREKAIIQNYIQGLKVLSSKYDDELLLSFVRDLEQSDAYAIAFNKTVVLAEMRDVPEERILRNKADIDKFFGG